MTGFKNILVGIDAEQPDPGTLAQAAAIGEKFDAKIKLLDTVHEFSWLSKAFTPRHEQLLEMLIHEHREKLEQIAVELGSKGLDVSVSCTSGHQSIALIREAQQHGHDLLMRVAKGRFSRRDGFLGTTAMRLLRKCPCALWLTNPQQKQPAAKVMAAVDATPEDKDHGQLNRRILSLASEVCDAPENLFVAYVWEVFGESILRAKMPEEEFADLEKQFQERNEASFNQVLARQGISLDADHTFLEHGDPVSVIPKLLEEKSIDLLVMGTVARTGIPGLLMGNTAESLVEQIKCGLLTIKPDEFGSPVPEEG